MSSPRNSQGMASVLCWGQKRLGRFLSSPASVGLRSPRVGEADPQVISSLFVVDHLLGKNSYPQLDIQENLTPPQSR